jgi:hypothetical protein
MEILKSNINSTSNMMPIIFVESSIYNRYTSQCNSKKHDNLDDVESKDDVCVLDNGRNEMHNLEINMEVYDKLNPVEFLKASLNMQYCDNRQVIEMICKFCENEKVVYKFKRKEISVIMDGVCNNKWNISVCKFFNFLLNRSILYRNKRIGDSDVNVYKV